jgi:hypothetical protein
VKLLSLGALAENEGYYKWVNMLTAKTTLQENSGVYTIVP